jgi:hypothetical protein
MAILSLKELAVAFNELDLRAYSRENSKVGTIIMRSPKDNLYHYMNRTKDATTGTWSWTVGAVCQKQPNNGANSSVEVDA